jgi:hypothetical protein
MIIYYSVCSQGSNIPKDREVEYKNARVVYKNNKIIVSTGRIERTWEWTGTGLLTISIKNQVTGKEYANKSGSYRCDWDMPAAINDSSFAEFDDLEISENDDEGFINRHLQVIATINYPEAKLKVQSLIWVFPGAPGIRTQLRIKAMEGFSPAGLPDNEGKRMDSGHWIAVPGARNE